MESFLGYIDLIKSVNVYDMLDEIFTNNRVQEEMIRLNQEQLQGGIDSQDEAIHTIGGHPYRPYTIAVKELKGQPTDRVTLYDTGEFYKSFRVKITQNGYEIIADFNKPDGDIRDNLPGEFDVLGLTVESIAELVWETIYPRLERIIKEKLNV